MSMTDLLAWLEERHARIIALEERGQMELHARDVPNYRLTMSEKAQILADLTHDGRKYMSGLPDDARMRVEHQLESFSASAGTALQLGSTFYMSALLYNDDHKKGEPDNLRIFIEQLKTSAS